MWSARTTTKKPGKYKINLLGEYNIGGDGFEIDRILKRCGITNIATFSGNSTYDQFAIAHTGRPELRSCATARSTTWPT